MTSRRCRVVGTVLLFVTPTGFAGAQVLSRLEGGASAGGSAFGWHPQLAVGGELPESLGDRVRLTLHGNYARIEGGETMRSELLAGARLSTAGAGAGWWIGTDVVRRLGLANVVEEPRISSGGWRRVGPFTLGLAATRRSARLNEMKHFGRSMLTYFWYLDSLTGRWDSTARVTTVPDSVRSSEGRLWMETQGSVAWEARRLSAQLTVGGRFATRNVPAGAWAGAEVAVRLGRPLSLVLGGGTASGSRFALDAEHRYLTLGFRLRPALVSTAAPTPKEAPDAIGPLGVDALPSAHYRLSLWAPRAHAVEITGDFTDWKPVSLTREEGGEWSVTLALLPGAHRVNARVDGGPWIVPPGLTTMTDDFEGEVGVLVIEGAVGVRK